MNKPDVLFHYANLETLALILRNRTIRFSRLDRVDDPQEQRSADSLNLGKMKFVSCWTSSGVESIPMWREYAGAESGVRIQMKRNPFKEYSLSVEDLKKVPRMEVSGNPGDSFEGLHLPIDDFWDKGYYFNETARSVEMLHKVEYTDDKSLLFPKVIANCDNGEIKADLNALGIYKATPWSYQNEWRYVLTTIPIGIASFFNGGEGDIKRALDVILDRCDPETPSFYDLEISDEAFSAMRITRSPKMTSGNRVILDTLVEKYAPGIEVAESSIELS